MPGSILPSSERCPSNSQTRKVGDVDANIVVFILGIAIIIVIAVVLLRGLGTGRSGEATFTLAELFSATVKFGDQDTDSADRAAREAAERRGRPLGAGP